MARKDCPVFNKNCGNCGIKGHFRAVCMKDPSHRSQANSAETATALPNQEEATQQDDLPSFTFATTEDFRLAPFPNNRP